ncbi:hypothetical protein [Pandoraea sputorum]|uniref:hypothetical protein n=1 Tax=Pandoraea sputorum TaxID=93222 RepID=UPI0012406217|nr:hypothetical protein [Pandoraea sputorum]
MVFNISKLIYLPVFVVILSGCISVPVDERSVAQRRDDFSRVAAVLVGEYSVVDRRRANSSVTSFSIGVRDDNLVVIGHEKGGDNFIVTGKKCDGWDQKTEKGISCGKVSDSILGLTFTFMNRHRTIAGGSLPFFSTPEMKVEPGDYLLEFHQKGGRTNSYLVKRD